MIRDVDETLSQIQTLRYNVAMVFFNGHTAGSRFVTFGWTRIQPLLVGGTSSAAGTRFDTLLLGCAAQIHSF